MLKVYTLKYTENGMYAPQMGENHFCFDKACTAKGKAATKPVGPGFDGSEPATRWKRVKLVMSRMG